MSGGFATNKVGNSLIANRRVFKMFEKFILILMQCLWYLSYQSFLKCLESGVWSLECVGTTQLLAHFLHDVTHVTDGVSDKLNGFLELLSATKNIRY